MSTSFLRLCGNCLTSRHQLSTKGIPAFVISASSLKKLPSSCGFILCRRSGSGNIRFGSSSMRRTCHFPASIILYTAVLEGACKCRVTTLPKNVWPSPYNVSVSSCSTLSGLFHCAHPQSCSHLHERWQLMLPSSADQLGYGRCLQ